MEGFNPLRKLPEIFKRKEKAQKCAQEIAAAGQLCLDFHNIKHYVGFISVFVYSNKVPTQQWWVNIRPVHFPGIDAKVFNFEHIRFIKFEYCEKGITPRHLWDPSTYLTIKDVG
ncbi:MAG: hypothetical protein AAB661_01565 [Patescibacteria group bacterium]